MNNKKKALLCVIAGVSVGSSSYAMDGYVDQFRRGAGSSTGRAVISGVATAATIYALYRFYNWCFRETDQQILTQAEQCIASGNKYASLLSIINERSSFLSMSSREQKSYLQNVNEDTLYQIAVAKHTDASISHYLTNMRKDLDAMSVSIRKLNERMPEAESCVMYTLLERAHKQLTDIHAEVDMLHGYLNQNKAYFKLYESEADIAPRYNQELYLLQQVRDDKLEQARVIRSFVVIESRYSSDPFPRIKYRTAIDADIAQLERSIDGARRYSQRLSASHLLLATLRTMRAYVISDEKYNDEHLEYQKHKKEQERIDIERKKAEAEERRARAEQERAQAEKEKAQAEREKARAERSRARAEHRRVDHETGTHSYAGSRWAEVFDSV